MPWPAPSTVPHLLLSNLPPSEIEVNLILDIVYRAGLYVSRTRKQLEIHPKNRVLKNQLRTYENNLTRHQSLLSPLRRLPPELLYQIFELFVPPPFYLNGPDKPGHWSGLPWSVSQVCHRWRAITLSMPFLWTSIPLLILDMEYTTNPSFLEFYTSFLLRSAGHPIGVFVASYNPRAEKAVKWHPAIKILVSHSYRWQHLSVVSNSPHLLRALRPVKKRVPILRTLNLELDAEAYLDIFQKAPKLSQVRLIGIAPERIALPWKQLVHYKGRHDQMGATIPLRSGPLMKTLELQSYFGDDLPEAQSSPIVLRNLVELKLCGVISSELTTFLLERLIVPAVEELAIYGDVFEGPIPVIPLVTSMISRSTNACSLQKLSIRESNYQPGEIIALLRLTPRLVFLDIKFPPIDDLIHLALIDSANVIVPLLHTLVITDDHLQTYYTKSIVMLLARGRCEETIGPLIGFDDPEPSRPQTPPTVPLRMLRINFLTKVYRREAQNILNGWTCVPSEQYPPHSELMLFCDWASELWTLFPHLIPNEFVCSKNFKRWVGPLTEVQKIMAFNKAMVNHKLEEVKNLFVRSISFYPIQTDIIFPHQRSGLLLYLDLFSHIHMKHIPGPVLLTFRGNQDSGVIHSAKVATPGYRSVQ